MQHISESDAQFPTSDIYFINKLFRYKPIPYRFYIFDRINFLLVYTIKSITEQLNLFISYSKQSYKIQNKCSLCLPLIIFFSDSCSFVFLLEIPGK